MEMKVPVAAKGEIHDREQVMRVYHDGTHTLVQSAPKPFIYTRFNPNELKEEYKNLFFDHSTEEVTVTPLSSKKEEQWFKTTFNSEMSTKYLNKQLREARTASDPFSEGLQELFNSRSMNTSQMRTKYVDQVLATDPEYFARFPCLNVTVMTLDIEQWSEGVSFEQTKKNPLMSIAATVTNGEGSVKHYFAADKPEEGFKPDDRPLLLGFIKMFKDADPDIIAGYNLSGYDIPVMCDRMKKHGIRTTFWDRSGQRDPWFRTGVKIGVHEFDTVAMDGRVVYDVFHSVMADQTLNGQVKDRKLKTIAKYYQKKGVIPEDFEIVEEDMADNRGLCGTPELKEYNESDVFITENLFKMYVKNNIAVAEFIGCPLDNVVPLATSYPFTIICARTLHEQGIISNGSNLDRNFKYFDVVGKPYQGAEVGINQRGRHENPKEADISSMYPSIIGALGLGPENTRIVKTIPYSEAPAQFATMQIGDARVYNIPDDLRQWTWVIEVVGRSPIADLTIEFLKDRMLLKDTSSIIKRYAEAIAEEQSLEEIEQALIDFDLAECIGNADHAKMVQYSAYVRAYGLKVVLNSEYGLAGAKYNDFGELAVACLITGIGREILKFGLDFLGAENNLLWDTDGIKTVADFSIDEMNTATDEFVVNQLYGLPIIRWELEEFQVIYVKEMKNYLLIDKKGELVIHGVAFKSSAAAPIFDRIIKELGFAMLKQGHEATRRMAARFYNMEGIDPNDFVLRKRQGKPIDSYAEGNQIRKIAELYKPLGVEPKVGNVYEFIKTRHGYEPVTDASMARLDTKYYRKVVDKALKALGYSNVMNMTLSEFF